MNIHYHIWLRSIFKKRNSTILYYIWNSGFTSSRKNSHFITNFWFSKIFYFYCYFLYRIFCCSLNRLYYYSFLFLKHYRLIIILLKLLIRLSIIWYKYFNFSYQNISFIYYCPRLNKSLFVDFIVIIFVIS